MSIWAPPFGSRDPLVFGTLQHHSGYAQLVFSRAVGFIRRWSFLH